jgi:Uri superfamily endonuclease
LNDKAVFSQLGNAAFAFAFDRNSTTLAGMTNCRSHTQGVLFPKDKGSYLLLFENTTYRRISVGKKLQMEAPPGIFIYAGSARGPGGLAARLAHHCRPSPNPRWHVDYLKSQIQLFEIWFTRDPRHLECTLAEAVLGLPGSHAPCPGFGSSDCSCESHLVYLPKRPAFKNYARHLAQELSTTSRLERHRLIFN